MDYPDFRSKACQALLFPQKFFSWYAGRTPSKCSLGALKGQDRATGFPSILAPVAGGILACLHHQNCACEGARAGWASAGLRRGCAGSDLSTVSRTPERRGGGTEPEGLFSLSVTSSGGHWNTGWASSSRWQELIVPPCGDEKGVVPITQVPTGVTLTSYPGSQEPLPPKCWNMCLSTQLASVSQSLLLRELVFLPPCPMHGDTRISVTLLTVTCVAFPGWRCSNAGTGPGRWCWWPTCVHWGLRTPERGSRTWSSWRLSCQQENRGPWARLIRLDLSAADSIS